MVERYLEHRTSQAKIISIEDILSFLVDSSILKRQIDRCASVDLAEMSRSVSTRARLRHPAVAAGVARPVFDERVGPVALVFSLDELVAVAINIAITERSLPLLTLTSNGSY